MKRWFYILLCCLFLTSCVQLDRVRVWGYARNYVKKGKKKEKFKYNVMFDFSLESEKKLRNPYKR